MEISQHKDGLESLVEGAVGGTKGDRIETEGDE